FVCVQRAPDDLRSPELAMRAKRSPDRSHAIGPPLQAARSLIFRGWREVSSLPPQRHFRSGGSSLGPVRFGTRLLEVPEWRGRPAVEGFGVVPRRGGQLPRPF